jgi:diguanylate cyclase (GGDEF)-like protein
MRASVGVNVPDHKVPVTGGCAAAETSFEPYGRLLKMLIPSLRGFAVHDGFANLIWSSAGWGVDDAEDFVKRAIASALSDTGEYPAMIHSIDADRALYSFVVRAENIELSGVVSLEVSIASNQSAPRPVQALRPLVQPALECLKRELSLRATLGSRDRDLDLMLQMSRNGVANATDADEFDTILKTAIDHMGCTLAALWVPEKDLSISLTRGGKRMAPDILRGAERHLIAWMQLRQRTIIVNRIAKQASEAAAPYKILACPITHPSGRVIGVLALFNPPSADDFALHQTRIVELLAKRASVVIMSQHDASTGLMTRQAFEQQAKILVASSGAEIPHSILYLDIDRLHVINENFGMHVGDEVIASVAQCLSTSIPAGSLAARISGDRLAALIPNADLAAATAVGERVRGAAAAIAPRGGAGLYDVSVSIGVAPLGRLKNPLAHGLAMAESACKAAKDRGRNRIEAFQDADQSIIRRHSDILVIGELRTALDKNSFRLDAQPILPLRSDYGQPRFELLLRMVGEQGQIIPPSKFLSAAERYQLMPTVDRWVVQRACELLGAHTGAVGADGVHFAINLSGQSLQDDKFLDFVIEQIGASGVAPTVLCFELTETATIGNLNKAQAFMRRLQSLGCQFALDDFGTGVSSLAYLKDLPVNYLKIDGTFVRDVIHSPRSESMIKAIAQLSKVMNMDTIAEYVETDVLRVRVAELGVDYGQGFAMGKTQRLEDLLQQLATFAATSSTGSTSIETDGKQTRLAG